MITALQLLKDQLENTRETFEGTVEDITPEMLSPDPGGKALPLGATWAHLVFSEDVIVQGMMQGKAPLHVTTWEGKTGASAPMPAMDENWSQNNEAWSKSVVIDLPQFRAYEQAVYAATDAYVASLKDEDLEREVDLGHEGKRTLAHLFSSFVIGHTNNLAGEISVLKGIQDKKGYQF